MYFRERKKKKIISRLIGTHVHERSEFDKGSHSYIKNVTHRRKCKIK